MSSKTQPVSTCPKAVSILRALGRFAAASERFSQANLNQTIDDSLVRYAEVAAEARRHDLPVRGYVSCAFGCPFEGEVHAAQVVEIARRVAEGRPREIALADVLVSRFGR